MCLFVVGGGGGVFLLCVGGGGGVFSGCWGGGLLFCFCDWFLLLVVVVFLCRLLFVGFLLAHRVLFTRSNPRGDFIFHSSLSFKNKDADDDPVGGGCRLNTAVYPKHHQGPSSPTAARITCESA